MMYSHLAKQFFFSSSYLRGPRECNTTEEQLFAARMPSLLLAIAADGGWGVPLLPSAALGAERSFCSGQGVQALDTPLWSLVYVKVALASQWCLGC